MPGVRDRTIRTQAVDLVTSEAELFEDFVIVLTEFGGAAWRHFLGAMHCERAAYRELQMFAGAFERDDHVVRKQLRVGRYFMWAPDDAVGDVGLVESVTPAVQCLRSKDLIQYLGQCCRVRDTLRIVVASRIHQQFLAAICSCESRPFFILTNT